MKNFKLFNQSFGTVGGPNQTDETLTRENRIGLMSYLRRTLMLLFAVLVMSVANIGMAWGADFTISEIVASGGTTKSNVKVSSSETSTTSSKKRCSSITSTNAVNIDGSANANYNTEYVEIQATSGTLSSLSVNIRGNSDGTNTFAAVFWTGNASGTCDSYSTPTYLNRTSSDCDATVSIALPANTKTVRLYRRVCISKSDNKTFASSNKTDVASGSTFNVFGITATASGGGPSHNVSAVTSTGTNTYGTVSAAASSVAEGGTTTITATPAAGYAFDHWTVSGTGATLSSTSTNPTTLTMGTADATVTAYFAESCDVQVFSLTDEIGSAVVTASDATVTAGTSLVMSNTAGRIRLTPASGKFKNGDKVEFGGTIGNTAKNYGIKIYASDGTTSAGNIYVAGTTSPLKASGTLSLASDQDYIFIARYDGTTTTLTSCEITRVSPCPSCSAPAAPTISGTTSYTYGGTITLTASCASGADASTTYTWYKGDTWGSKSQVQAAAVAGSNGHIYTKSAVVADAGTYWCEASNGTGCEAHNSTGKAITVAKADLTCTPGTGSASSITTTGATLPFTLTNTTGVGSVTIKIYNNSTDALVKTVSGITAATSGSQAVTGLSSNTTYYYKVTPIGDSNHNDGSESGKSSTFTTLTQTYTVQFLASPNTYGTVSTSSVTVNEGTTVSSQTNNVLTVGSNTITATVTNDANYICRFNNWIWSGHTWPSTVTSDMTIHAVFTRKNIAPEITCSNNTVTISNNGVGTIYYTTNGTDPTSSSTTYSAPFAIEETTTVKAIVISNPTLVQNSDITTEECTYIAPSCTDPDHVDISGDWHFYPGETLELTATAYDDEDNEIAAANITGYQWQKFIESDWADLDGETSATYTKVNATTSDVGQYRCIVSTGATCSTASGTFNAKCLQLYVYYDDKSDKCIVPFTKVDEYHATVDLLLENGSYTYYYKITDGCNNWWGNNGTMNSGNCTDWSMNVNNHCGLTTTKSATYTFNLGHDAGLTSFGMSVIYPSYTQTGGYDVYFDNSGRNWSKVYYRIGRNNYNSKAEMSKVYGTANLYHTTTIGYSSDGGFHAWHIANNGGWSEGNSIYKTKNLGDWTITEATRFEGAPIPSAGITVTPGSDHTTGGTSGSGGSTDDANNNCEFYGYSAVSGMRTDNVSITAPSNGTITVAYTDVSNSAQSFTSGNRDLAHTVIITPTAAPSTGYDLTTLTVNGSNHTSGTTYTCSGATVVAATFSLHNYNVTYSAPGNGNSYTIKVGSGSASSESKTATMGQTITLVASPTTGYDFTGWTINKAGGGTVTPADASATTTTFTMPADNVTIIATFALKTYTVSFAASPAGYGSVSPTSIASVTHGSTVSISSNVLTLKGTNVTATPTAAGSDYTYAFSSWSVSNGASITSAQTITANFTRTANQYSVTHTLTNMTTASGETGANAATYGTQYTATLNAAVGYARPASITVMAGETNITANCTWNQSTGAVTIPGSYITGNIVITAAGDKITYTVTYAGNGNTGGTVPTDASSPYDPDDVVTVAAGVPTKSGSTFVGWLNSTNNTIYRAGQTFTITANTTLTAQWSTPTVTTYYYGQVKITSSALVVDIPSGSIQFFTNTGGTIASSDAISLTSTPSTGGIYYYSNNLSDSELSKSSNWSSSSSSGRYIRGLKFASGTTYTLALGTKVATSIKFYGWCGSASKTMTVGGQSFTSSSTKNTFETHDFTKSGNFTGNVSITQDGGDFYGILVITTSTPSGYNVTFNASGKSATGMPSNYSGVPSGKKIAAPIEIPTVTNFIFDGWVTTSGGSTAFDFANTTINADKTIYAKWTAKTAPTQYTFSLSDPCASASPSATLSGSQSGWSYQLYKDGVASGDPKSGTGSALTWTSLAAGEYYVKTEETATQASEQIGSSATVYAGTSITTNLPTSTKYINANASYTYTIAASGTSLSYQWYTCNSDGTGKVAMSDKTTASMTYTFTNSDAPTKYVCCVVTGTCGTITSNVQPVNITPTYYLTINLNGGSGGGISSGNRPAGNFTIANSSTIPTKSGYVFLGWKFSTNNVIYQPGATVTMPSAAATLTAQWETACASITDAAKNGSWSNVASGGSITDDVLDGTITGATLKNSGSGTLSANDTRGLVLNNNSTLQLTIALTGGMFQVGTVIEIGGISNNSNSTAYGFLVSNRATSPATYTTTAAAYQNFTVRYVVTEDDGIEGTNSFTVKQANSNQVYFKSLTIGGCMSCTPITPSLSYDNTTLYAFGGTPRGAVPTLTGNTGSGAVSYSSSNTDVVTVDSETGVVTAVGAGTATITASIASAGDYCGANATCNITVPALVTQTLNVASSTAWGTTPALTFSPSDKGMEQVLRLTKNTFTFDSTSTSTKQDGTSKRWMTASFTGSETTKGKYLKMAFKNTQHNLRLGEVVVPIQPISSNGSAQVEIYEGSTLRMTSTAVTGITAGSLADVHFTFASPYVFAAGSTINVYIYFYGQTNGFRMASPVLVNGAVLVDQKFTGAGDNNWSNEANWDSGSLPEIYHDVVIEKPVVVDITSAVAKSIVLDQYGDNTGTLDVPATGALVVAESIQKKNAEGTLVGTSVNDLSLSTNSTSNGALIMKGYTSGNNATVNFYTKAYKDASYGWINQFIASPFNGSSNYSNYYGSYLYMFSNSGQTWVNQKSGSESVPFAAYNLLRKDAAASTLWMQGELTTCANQTCNLYYDGSSEYVENMIGNSWTAPINIAAMGTSAFTNCNATIYLFNAGSNSQADAASDPALNATSPGQYIALPVNTADWTGATVRVIPAMQAFIVRATAASPSVTLNYTTMVYDPAIASTTYINTATRAPRRGVAAADDKPEIMRLYVKGVGGYGDVVHMLMREDWTTGFENGYDAHKMDGVAAAPQMYAVSEAGNMTVNCVSEAEGTIIGFRPGEDTEYTFTFEYDGEKNYYLNDLKEQVSTLIREGESYMFTATEDDGEQRFIISATPFKAPTITTGVGNTEDGSQVTKVIYKDHIYIIRGGQIYDATGKTVK